MASHPSIPRDWRDENGYAALNRAEPAAMAWEWLRRDAAYQVAATAARVRTDSSGLAVLAPDPEAARWGLHAFEDPAFAAGAARPMWRRSWLGLVLPAIAEQAGPAADRFDLSRFSEIATVVPGENSFQHLLLSDGWASLRLDVVGGTLLDGPVRLNYLLAGFAGARGPLATLQNLLRLWQSGRLDQPASRARNRRLILLLRAHDAVQCGASQREIAEVLLSAEAARARWRSEVPSLRLQAQRLVKGARAMAHGAFRTLLSG